MSVIVDLTPGPDLAMRMPNGVACGGSLTCPVGQDCCISFANNMATGAMCVASASQCMGATLACDGPEDCPMTGQTCCATVDIVGMGDAAGTITGGNSKCNSCSPAFTTGTLTTRLCHVPADCNNFSFGAGGFKLDFNKCCSNGMGSGGGIQFCAPDPAVLTGLGVNAAYTCQ
jgi:hypothetical protein